MDRIVIEKLLAEKQAKHVYRDQLLTLKSLPTLPQIAVELQEMIRTDQMSVRQLVPVVDRDPALAARIIRMANSAYYALEEPVDSLRRAIVVLGLKELYNMALSFSIIDEFKKTAVGEDSIRWDTLWIHSIAVGHIVELLNNELGLWIAGSPYAMGLLHDIGKIALFLLDSTRFRAAIELARMDRQPLTEAEKAIFGFTHETAGEWVVKRWNFPQTIMTAVAHHHTPLKVPSKALRLTAALLQVADGISHKLGFYLQGTPLTGISEIDPAWRYLQREVPKLRELTCEEFLAAHTKKLDGVRSIVKSIKL